MSEMFWPKGAGFMGGPEADDLSYYILHSSGVRNDMKIEKKPPEHIYLSVRR